MSSEHDPTTDEAPFRSAEAWLAAKGVQRDPIVVRAEPGDQAADAPDGRTPVHVAEAVRLATEAPPPEADADADGGTDRPGADHEAGPGRGHLEDEVRRALAVCQRITAQAPQSEARLRSKLSSRDLPRVVIDLALERCRELGIVDDEAMATALAQEKQRKGHAPSRIRKDLSERGFTREVLDRVLAAAERADPEAAAFAVGRERAARMTHLEPETAFRRLVGFLARRGYPEGLSRKVAREVVYADRESQRVAQR